MNKARTISLADFSQVSVPVNKIQIVRFKKHTFG